MNKEKKSNPFLVKDSFKVIRGKTITEFEGSGNVISNMLNSLFLYEQTPKVSLYKIGYIRNLMLSLQPQSVRLFLYIAYTLKKDEDVIHLPLKKVKKTLGVSNPTYYRAISELSDCQILAKKSREYYWINPVFLFYGNKIAFFKRYCEDCIEVIHKM